MGGLTNFTASLIYNFKRSTIYFPAVVGYDIYRAMRQLSG